jgi:integrase
MYWGQEVRPVRLKRVRPARDGVFGYKTGSGLRWGVEYRDPATHQPRRRRGFPSKELALRFKEQAERQLLGLDPKKSDVLVEAAVEHFVEDKLRAGRSIRSYYHLVVSSKRGQVPGLWTKALGKRRIADITSEDIDSVLRETARRRRWANSTQNRAVCQLAALFSYVRRRRWVREHPLEHGQVAKLPENNARTRWLRVHELEDILEKSPPWLADTVRFAASTGMRLGEVCSLRRANYQVDARGRSFLITEKTKNGESLAWPLEGWPRECVDGRVKTTKFPGDRLFPGPKGGNAYTSIHRFFPKAVRAAGLVYGTKHSVLPASLHESG